MSTTQRGQADHRAVEVYERCARVARENGVAADRVERLIAAAVLEDFAITWWERRGYDMTAHEATQPAGG